MAGSHSHRRSRTDPALHGHGHGHGHGPAPDVAVRPLARVLLLGVLAAVLGGVVLGAVSLWPDRSRVDELSTQVQFAAPGVTFPKGEVLEVQPTCATVAESATATDCGGLRVRVTEGLDDGRILTVIVPPEVLRSGLEPGDPVKLIRTPGTDGNPAGVNYFGTVRESPVLLLGVLFVVVVLAVARWRGFFALCGLAFAAVVLGWFVLPALLAGEEPLLVGAVGAAVIMYVVLYTTHGFSLRTSAALAGTLAGIGVTALLGLWSVRGARVTGVADEGSRLLGTFAPELSFQGLFTCAVLIAGLGVLNDVTITQASAVWEIRGAAPGLSRRQVFASGMRIGRDHIASTIYTIVFAYAGTALTILLVLSLYDRPFLDLLATEEIGQEIVRTLTTSIGLVLAVPLTTAIATATLPRAAHARVSDADGPAGRPRGPGAPEEGPGSEEQGGG